MAFPEVTLKDALNGPNGELGANWTTPAFTLGPVDSNFVLFGGHAAPSERPASATYDAEQHPADADVTIMVYSGCASPNTVELLLRMDLAEAPDGYRLEFAPGGASMAINLYRASTGTLIDTVTATGASIPAGGQIGARLVDDVVTPYIDFVGDGTWTEQPALATDGEVTGAGYAGFRETPGGGGE